MMNGSNLLLLLCRLVLNFSFGYTFLHFFLWKERIIIALFLLMLKSLSRFKLKVTLLPTAFSESINFCIDLKKKLVTVLPFLDHTIFFFISYPFLICNFLITNSMERWMFYLSESANVSCVPQKTNVYVYFGIYIFNTQL